jgi:hypothetical protein
VLAAYPGDAGGHPVGQLLHCGHADGREKLVAVGEMPVGGVGYDADRPGRFPE